MLTQITTVVFSTTGQTRTLVEQLGKTLGEKLGLPVNHEDFTLPAGQKEKRQYGPDTLVVFGTPTYAGRVPNKALPFVETLFEGKGTPALALVTYGNRNYDSSLTELRNELQDHGFVVLGAGAFAAPHAFAQIGGEHPTAQDKEAFAALAQAAAEVLKSGKPLKPVTLGDEKPVAPYYIPLGEDGQPAKFLKAKPLTDSAKCDHCGICAKVCPMGSINPENTDEVPGICIKCQACVVYCPQKAKYFDDARFLSHKAMLESHYQKLAPSVVFLPKA